MTIMAPKDTRELESMLEYSREFNGPIAIRYPKGYELSTVARPEFNLPYWEPLFEGESFVILAVGKMVATAVKVREILAARGIDIGVVNARVIKPLDKGLLLDLHKRYKVWITLEDNAILGGFGSSVNEFVNENDLKVNIKNYGIPDTFIPHGDVDILYRELQLDAESLAWDIKDLIDRYEEHANAGS